MRNLFIIGPGGAGKTTIALGLLARLKDEGFDVRYFKPVGVRTPRGEADEDARLMKALLASDLPLEAMVPVYTGPFYLTTFPDHREPRQHIERAYRTVAADAGDETVCIIEGARLPQTMGGLGLDAFSLAGRLRAGVLVVQRVETDWGLDDVCLWSQFATSQELAMIGTIFNQVRRPLLKKTQEVYRELLEAEGYPLLGVVPADVTLTAPTVRQYQEVLGGEILEGAERLDRVVEEVVVGAMNLESALHYLRRMPRKAVVTGGDRADLALAALETDTSVLVLTGGLYPPVRVLARAREREIPVILVHYDTYTTLETIQQLVPKLTAADRDRIRLAQDNFASHCSWQRLRDGILGIENHGLDGTD